MRAPFRPTWHRWLRLGALVLALGVVPAPIVGQVDKPAAPTPPEAASGSKADQLARLINRARLAEGLMPLARSAELDAAAEAHSRDMAAHNYLDHRAPDGSLPQDRARRAGYEVPPNSGWIVVEVISAISADPAGPLDWWLKESPDIHGKVLRDPRWREVGVGYASGGQYGNYWTVLVGCRPGVLPEVVVDGVAYRHEERCDQSGATNVAVSRAQARVQVWPGSATAGGAVRLTWSGIPSPNRADWLGLFRAGEPDTAYRDWMYVSCARILSSPHESGSCTLPLSRSLPPGMYEVRLFPNGGFTPVARSDAFRVSAAPEGSPDRIFSQTGPRPS